MFVCCWEQPQKLMWDQRFSKRLRQISSFRDQHTVTALTEPLCIIDELMAIWRRCEVFERLSDSFKPVPVQRERAIWLFLKYIWVSHLFFPQSCRLEGMVMSQIAENLPLASRCFCCMGRVFDIFLVFTPPTPEVFPCMPSILHF